VEIAERKVKCGWCEISETKDLMLQDTNKKYYHKTNCHNSYLQDRENKRIETEKKTSLAIKIADVHGLESYKYIPHSLFPYLEDLRNDSDLFGKLRKNYKNGLSYSAIEYTYEFCREKIDWAKKNKVFENVMSELKYGLAIVKNNVVDAKNYSDKMRKSEENKTRLLSITKEDESHFVISDDTTITYQKKKDNLDISDLL
jgi:hypothetical protein